MKRAVFIIISALIIFSAAAAAYEVFGGGYSYTNAPFAKYSGSPEKDSEVLFIVDFSGSMNSTIDGVSLKKYAADAIKDILARADASSRIGLRIFGIPDGDFIERNLDGYEYNYEKLCRASVLVFPPAGYNRAGILDTLDNSAALGVTPIDYSLRQAVQNDFTQDENVKKHIILVTDGAENCGGDPCRYVKELMSMRRDYQIDVIGITLDDNSYSQLKCISDAGRGTFYDVNTPEDFKVKFMQAYKNPHTPSFVDTLPPAPKRGAEYKNFMFQFNY